MNRGYYPSQAPSYEHRQSNSPMYETRHKSIISLNLLYHIVMYLILLFIFYKVVTMHPAIKKHKNKNKNENDIDY